MQSKTCIVVAGPTAVGKTDTAIELARHFNTSIISADSRQCYKELNIGVAKPDASQLNAVPHYFINSHSIVEEVNAATFEAYALNAADEIFKSSDYAIVVGGTGLYIKAFCEGMDEIPSIPPVIRQQIIQDYGQFGLGWLQEEVRVNDPRYYESGETNNPQRLMRALEVKRFTGASITSFQKASKKERSFQIIKTALELPRETLYYNINTRVDQMLNKGLLEEVKALLPYAHYNALQTVGYQEIFEYLQGKTSLDTAIDHIKKHTRHYAKRQLTWFKKDLSYQWFAAGDRQALLEYVHVRKSTK
jgi:tRNA dimethylallyltransferase